MMAGGRTQRSRQLRRAVIGVAGLAVVYLVFWYAAAPRVGDLYNSTSFAKRGSREFTERMYLRTGSAAGDVVGASSTSGKYSVTRWRVLPTGTASMDPAVYNPQNTMRVSFLIRELHEAGLKLHGFGFKTSGLEWCAEHLASADSLAWSFNARKNPAPCPWGEATKHCGNCLGHALHWRHNLLAGIGLCDERNAFASPHQETGAQLSLFA